MAEQLALANSTAPSAWHSARQLSQHRPLVRVIDLKTQRQEFVEAGPACPFGIFDGSTHLLNVPPGGTTPDSFDALIAEYDRRWAEEHA
jgi:hypothetical protein